MPAAPRGVVHGAQASNETALGAGIVAESKTLRPVINMYVGNSNASGRESIGGPGLLKYCSLLAA